MGFEPAYPVEGLRGAEYNPRAINADSLAQLQKSISTLGFSKPIIVTKDGLIVAGHQRSKAARALGRTHVPAFILAEISKSDEVRFNQLHNGTDLEVIDSEVTVPATQELGFTDVPGADVQGNQLATGATVRKEICSLMLRYGQWGAIVATQSGQVVSSPQYALACKLLNVPVRTFRILDYLADDARSWFGRAYGEFSYGHLPKNPYLQTYAQPYRLRGGRSATSVLYEEYVLPNLQPTERLLDFGCGQGDYLKLLQKRCHPAFGVEFFFRQEHLIDGAAVHRLIDTTLADVRKNGLFDVVVIDAVITSIDSMQAHDDVLTCANAFCKPGGRIYFSGRSLGKIEAILQNRKAASRERYLEFVDKDGFSGMYREGAWFYQKFHRTQQIQEACERFFGPMKKLHESKMWQAWAVKTVELSVEVRRASIAREFDLPWPGGRSVGRASQALAALGLSPSSG